MMVKVNPPLMRRPNKSWHRTSVNLLQNKTKKIFNEIVTPITAIIGFSDEKYFERKQVRLYWDSTPVTRHWKVFSSNLETGALHQSVEEQRLLSWTCQGSRREVKWVMSLQTQRAFYSPNSNSISGSQRMNGSRLAKECHSIHHIKFLITSNYRAKPSTGFLTSPGRAWHNS